MFLLWVLRFFAFNLYESPKYLMGRGRDAKAVEVVRKVAVHNGRTVEDVKVTEKDLKEVGKLETSELDDVDAGRMDTSVLGVVKRRVRAVFGGEHLAGLFKTRKLAYSTSLLVMLWGEIGLLPSALSYASPFICSVDWLGVSSVSTLNSVISIPCNPWNVRYNAFVTY